MGERNEWLVRILEILDIEARKRTKPEKLYEHIEKKIYALVEGREWTSFFEMFEAVLELLEGERDRIRRLCDEYTPYFKERRDGTNVLSSKEIRAGKAAYQPLRDLGISDTQAQYQAEGRERGYHLGTTVGESFASWVANAHMAFLEALDEQFRFGEALWGDVESIAMGASSMDSSDVREWVKPYSNAFRARLEALPFVLSDTMKDLLVGAYEESVMEAPNERLNAGYVKQVGRMISVDLMRSVRAFQKDVRDPDFGGDAFENLRDSLRNALGGVIRLLDEVNPDIGEGLLQYIFDMLINGPDIKDAVDQVGTDIGRTLFEATAREVENATPTIARAFNEAYAPYDSTAFSFDNTTSDSPALRGLEGVATLDLTPLLENLSNLAEVEEEVYQKLLAVNEELENLGEGQDSTALQRTQELLLGAAMALQDIRNGNSAMEELDKQVQSLGMRTEANKNLRELAEGTQKNKTAFKDLDQPLKDFIRDHNLVGKSMDEVIQSLDKEGKALASESGTMISHLEGLRDHWIGVKADVEAGANGTLDADGSRLMQQADESIQWLNLLLRLLGAAGGEDSIAETGGGRGGGGKSRKERAAEEARKAAEEARRAQEAEWQRELDEQLKFLDRKKRLNEINTQEEIRHLEYIAAHYARTTQQKISMEEKLFEARARLRDEEIAEIDKLNQGVITALRNRYEEQRKIEEKRLKDSADGWREWADESVKAIQAQIDALDALNKQEDRDEQERKKLHKIEATREMIAYTHDDANRERLERELRRLEEDYAKWQRTNAIADEKERLRAEQEAIRERAAQEQEAIAKQRDGLADLYEERLKSEALRAEAERMLTQADRGQLLELLGSHAPDYDAWGTTLGQRLHGGLTGMLGNITDWFVGFNGAYIALQDHMMRAVLDASDVFYAGAQQRAADQAAAAPPVTNVDQHNHFYIPVESPADTARKVQHVNEELAAILYR